MSNLQNDANSKIVEILNAMKLDRKGWINEPTVNRTFFTGWKEVPVNTEWMYHEDGVFLGSGKAVGQLVHFIGGEHPRKCFFVNLPGMERGFIKEGECFDIGSERIDLNNTPSLDEVGDLLTKGLSIMNELLANK